MGRHKRETSELVKEVTETLEKPVENMKETTNFNKVVSTGSTLLDLAISGTRRRGGGIPPGILVEIFGPTGCVDSETEFLSPIGWKKISEWKEEKVLQYNLDGTAQFVVPQNYIVKPAERLFYFKTKYGIDQCLSSDHCVLYRRRHNGKLFVKPFFEVMKQHNNSKNGFYGQFLTTFNLKLDEELPLSDDELRVQVMVIADGSFRKKINTNWCTLNIKKQRKKNRAQILLEKAGIEYKYSNCKNGYSRFYFHAPIKTKEFGDQFFQCSKHQLEVIVSEIFNWDGNQNKEKKQFYSTNEKSADFIQYALTICGKRSNIYVNKREDKSSCYVVYSSNQIYPTMVTNRNKTKIIPFYPKDKKQYCFNVDSGFLVLRRNKKIFITGNSGKTTVLGEICASAQTQGGNAIIGDAERRMTSEFIKYMGIQIDKDNLSYPFTVKDVEELIFNVLETGNGIIDIVGVDSIASLVSGLEDEKGDKRGGAKAKELHSLCRRAKGEIAKKNRLVVFTNQIQDVQDAMLFAPKEKTPGGHAVPFYSSLRMRVGPSGSGSKLSKEITVGNRKLKKIIGIRSTVSIIKSSIDVPFREADVFILFNYGIDDIRGNLQYLKDATGSTMYDCVDKEIRGMDEAIQYIEQNNYQEQLKNKVIDVWMEMEEKFKQNRQPKVR